MSKNVKGEKMEMENERDFYDCVIEGVAEFAGLFALSAVRYATMRNASVNDNTLKMVLRETGSISLGSVAMSATTYGVKAIGKLVKPYIVRK